METIYDLMGIGIGPFNLGLAALCDPIKRLNCLFIDQKAEFDWHAGMMIPGCTLQVSYLADLVTLADPSSKFSYLNYLRSNNKLLQFGIHEGSYITRSEYNRYCKWVCSKLDNLLFGHRVMIIVYRPEGDCFEIRIKDSANNSQKVMLTRNIIIGTGSRPNIPSNLEQSLGDGVFHSSSYLYHKSKALKPGRITVVGSGQSAAEIFYDLICTAELSTTQVNWVTRSDRFYAMEHSKLNYEMTSPDYIDFFYDLDADMKEWLLQRQFTLYKGINFHLIDSIYDKLYQLFNEHQQYRISIRTCCELKDIAKNDEEGCELLFYHSVRKAYLKMGSDFVILATGYKYTIPHFLKSIQSLIQFDSWGKYAVNRNYSIDRNNRIFVQNAEMQTHGFNAPDLGLGAYRNAVIINSILKKKYYPVDSEVVFQCFRA